MKKGLSLLKMYKSLEDVPPGFEEPPLGSEVPPPGFEVPLPGLEVLGFEVPPGVLHSRMTQVGQGTVKTPPKVKGTFG